MNKVVFVEAHFAPVGETKFVKVPTGEKKKGIFGEKDVMKTEKKFVQTGVSDTKIDTSRLAKDLQAAVERLNSSGYEVVSVTNIISGKKYHTGVSGGGGYGFGYTDGLMIVARKIGNQQ